jgi:hypothetical protein
MIVFRPRQPARTNGKQSNVVCTHLLNWPSGADGDCFCLPPFKQWPMPQAAGSEVQVHVVPEVLHSQALAAIHPRWHSAASACKLQYWQRAKFNHYDSMPMHNYPDRPTSRVLYTTVTLHESAADTNMQSVK